MNCASYAGPRSSIQPISMMRWPSLGSSGLEARDLALDPSQRRRAGCVVIGRGSGIHSGQPAIRAIGRPFFTRAVVSLGCCSKIGRAGVIGVGRWFCRPRPTRHSADQRPMTHRAIGHSTPQQAHNRYVRAPSELAREPLFLATNRPTAMSVDVRESRLDRTAQVASWWVRIPTWSESLSCNVKRADGAAELPHEPRAAGHCT